MGWLGRLFGMERSTYHATHLNERIETSVGDTRGVLVEIIPNPDNHGPASMASVYEAMYEPATGPVHTVEIWFHKGEARFFINAASEESADSIRRSLGNSYEDSIVRTLDPEAPAHPTITADDAVSGGRIVKAHPTENHHYFMIKNFAEGEGWLSDQNPIADIISHMQTDKETSVVLQLAIEPMSNGEWTGKKWYVPFDESANDVQETYRDRGDSDLKRMVGKQTSQSPFVANLRVLTISPSADEASNRAQAVAGLIERRFTSEETNTGFSATPVDALWDGRQQRKMRSFIENIRTRSIDYGHLSGLGDKELTAIHIPSGESSPPSIGWEHSRSGSDAPVGLPEHNTPSLDDIPSDKLPVLGGYSPDEDEDGDTDTTGTVGVGE